VSAFTDHPKVRGFSWPFIGGVRNGSKGHADSSTMHDGRR
jgi:hypothetical protein